MSNYKEIRSFKDIRMEKETIRYKIMLAEKQMQINVLEIKNQIEIIKTLGSLVNKLLESFFFSSDKDKKE